MFPCAGGLENFHPSSESRRRRRKWDPVLGRLTELPYHWIGAPGCGLEANLMTFLCKKKFVEMKSKTVKTGCNLVECMLKKYCHASDGDHDYGDDDDDNDDL
jgi:hypothetical protein